MRRSISSAFILFFSVSVVFFTPLVSACAPAQGTPTVYTTLPWITSMARFIVGSTMRILPLSSWNETGALKNLRRVPPEAEVIALDPSDAERHGLKAGREGLHFLYGNLPVPEEKRSSLQFDPSALPFLSQRLLIVVSSLQPENYTFYQRRLAEFQSRMESTLEVGRSQIQGVKMLDLTGAASSWVRAAALEAVRPPEYLWTAWTRGERTRELTLAVSEAAGRGWWIVVDAWTPRRILAFTDGASKIVHIPPPENDQDFFVYLHDIYLQMWNATARK